LVRHVVKVHEAKTRLSALLVAVEAGDEVVISRGDTPVARLVSVASRGSRELGFVGYRIPESFFAPLPDEELDAWEASEA
jgi:prevent-host-death family protein